MTNENKEKFENDGGLISDIKEGATENREDMMLQEHDPEVIEKELDKKEIIPADPELLLEGAEISDEEMENLKNKIDPEMILSDMETNKDGMEKIKKEKVVSKNKKYDLLQNYSDERLESMRKTMVDGIKTHDGKWWNETTKELANDTVVFVPFAGPTVQVIDAIRGKELIGGKKLEKKERAWKAIEGSLFLALDCYTAGIGGDVAKGGAKAVTRTAAYLRTLGAPRSVSKTVFKTGKFIAKNPKLVLLADKALDTVSTSRKSGKLKDKLSETVNETLIKKAEIDLKKESDPDFKIETEKFEKHEKEVNDNYEIEEKNKKKAMINEVIKGE